MSLEFNFGEVEAVLIALNRIADDKKVAFRARLKHLQRLGFPEGANTGTGKRAVYTLPMMLQMCFATQLLQTGMSPMRVVKMMRGNWYGVEGFVYVSVLPPEMLSAADPPVPDNRYVWVISPESLRELTVDGEGEFDYHDSVQIVPLGEIAQKLDITPEDMDSAELPNVGELYRQVLLQLRPLMHLILFYIVQLRPALDVPDILRDFERHLVEKSERLQSVAKALNIPEKKL